MQKLETLAPGIVVHVVRIDRQDTEAELANGRIDLALDAPVPVSYAVHQKELSVDKLVVVARRNHPGIKGSLTLEFYLAQTHILVSSPRLGPSLIDIELKDRGQQRVVRLKCEDYFTACRVVSKTNMLVTMGESYALRLNAGLNNRLHSFPASIPHFTLNLYWHQMADADKENQWLRKLISDLFRSDDESKEAGSLIVKSRNTNRGKA